jgi:hypothetical protein
MVDVLLEGKQAVLHFEVYFQSPRKYVDLSQTFLLLINKLQNLT